ncbi:MAG: glycoside hydrolase family protein [Candidatus Dojkabacteria bacterium]|nr:glycoside hydrolase family protein [Candidatus Dojkabacteria bacterium]
MLKLSEKGIKFFIENQHKSYNLGKYRLYDNLDGKIIQNYNQARGDICIGFGHKVTEKEKKNNLFLEGISEQEALEILKKDINIHESTIARYIKVDLDEHQYDSLFCFSFDYGEKIFSNKLFTNSINKKDFSMFLHFLDKSIVFGGKEIEYFKKKREREKKLFLYKEY